MNANAMLKSWVNYATPKARNIVRSILAARPDVIGLSSQQIFQEAHIRFPNEYAPPPPPHELIPGQKGRFGQPPKVIPEPPKRDHPIRSMKYLKKIVLEDLAHRGEVEKIHIRRGSGGTDVDGNVLDAVGGRGVEKYKSKTGIVAKEAWLWRLKSNPVLDPKTSEPLVTPKFEEDEREELTMLNPEGWTKDNLKFINVPRINVAKYQDPA